MNLTPCVYPIIPVTISYFAGQSDRRQSRLFAHGACYVIGLAVTNSLLGVTAALTGGLMGWVLVGMAAYYLRALLPKIVYTFLLTSVAFAAGLHLGCMSKVQAQSSKFKWIRAFTGTIGLVLATLLIGGWVLRGPGVTWHPYSDDLLENARRNGTPVIVDF